MKRATVFASVVVAMLAAVSAQDALSAEPQQRGVPAAVLGELGLGGMQAVSDAAGLTVRGRSNLGNSVVGVDLAGKFPTLFLPGKNTQIVAAAAITGLTTADLAPPAPIKK